jgi:hypothetical protein
MKQVYLAIIATFLVFNAKAQNIANFDDLSLTSASYWNGSDQTGSFKSGDATFFNSYNSDWDYWSGFSYSNLTDVNTPGYGNQYSAITGKGNMRSANYSVCYPSPTAELRFSRTTKTTGFYVTNSTYAYLSMKSGDAFAKKFGGETGNDPDYFKLMIEALNKEGKPVDTLYFYLADFQFTDNSKDYILNKWTWVDLSELKEAQKLRFSLSSSDNSFGYMNTPGYFCMDDFNGEKPYDYKPVTYAGFEDINLGSAGYFNGSDQKGSFTSGNFRFLNDYIADWGSWSGFAVSSGTDILTTGYNNQYSAITGQGVAGTPAYSVVYPTPVATVILRDTVISGLYVTNSTYAYQSMKNGDTFAKKFGGENGNDPDYLILTIEGFAADNQSSGKIEFFLADFTYSINSYDYILDSWKWIDLSKFGRISKLEFSLRSTDNGNWGMNTPGYFCIDNLNHEVLTSSPEILQVQAHVFPNPFTNQISISGIIEKAKVTISDLSGKTVGEYHDVINNQSINNLQNFGSGVYFISVTEGSNRFTRKLIKK